MQFLIFYLLQDNAQARDLREDVGPRLQLLREKRKLRFLVWNAAGRNAVVVIAGSSLDRRYRAHLGVQEALRAAEVYQYAHFSPDAGGLVLKGQVVSWDYHLADGRNLVTRPYLQPQIGGHLSLLWTSPVLS